jgi:rRNA biogenesis protein RRP5
MGLGIRRIKRKEDSSGAPSMQEVYPVGMILEGVKVLRVEAERGAVVEVEPGLDGFVHVRPITLGYNMTLNPLPSDLAYFG